MVGQFSRRSVKPMPAAPGHGGAPAHEVGNGASTVAQSHRIRRLLGRSRASGVTGDGAPLQPATRAYFEPRFGQDLSDVRVHDDSAAARSAKREGAQAYTVGEHIVLAQGSADSPSRDDRWVMAHELTHVLQQRQAAGIGQSAGGMRMRPAPPGQIQRLDAPPTRLDVSDIMTSLWADKRESEMDAAIARLQGENATDGRPKLGQPEYRYGQGLDENDRFNRIALKASLLAVIQNQQQGEKYADGEYRLRIAMQVEPMGLVDNPEPELSKRDEGFVIVQFDKARNARMELASVEGMGRFSSLEGSLRQSEPLMETLKTTYEIEFVQDAVNFRSNNHASKPWSDRDLILIRDALELIGGTETALLKGAKLRRLQGANFKGLRGFFLKDGQDRSINFFDDAMPFEKGTWVGEDGREHSYGVHTTLHELGHLLHFSPAPPATGAGKDYLDLFKDAVWAKSGAKRDNSFPPPNVELPTVYSGTGDQWIDLFADTYSIYMTNPSFLRTPVHQYLYDFFKAHFP